MVALEQGSGMSHSSPENIEFGLHEVDETCRTALLNFPAVRSLRCSLRSRRLEVVGERENGRARGRHARGRCKSVRSRFPDEMTIWTRWELEELGLATLNGQQQRVSCFPTLLRNDLNLSDVVHFTTHDSNLSCNKSGFCKLCTVVSDF